MPPRKPLSSRAPLSRRDGQPSTADRTTVQPPPRRPSPVELDEEANEGSYSTGSDYPVVDDGDAEPSAPSVPSEWDLEAGGNLALGDEEFAPPTARYREGEDIYGEDDPFPEDEELAGASPSGAPLRGQRSDTRGIPQVDVTRIGVPSEDEEGTNVDRPRGRGGNGDDDFGLEDDDDGDENATRAGPPMHLEVISGPDMGRRRRFRSVRMVIGRAAGCDFRLQDASVSRRHLELVLGDGGVLLRDLGSGNGTKVNDEKVAEHRLEDGDEISIGKTRFRFVDELAALRKRNEEAEAAAKAEAEAAAAEASPEEGADPQTETPELATDSGEPLGGEAGHPGAEAAPEPEPTQARARPIPSRRPGAGGAGAGVSALLQHKKLVIGAAAGTVLLLLLLAAALSGVGNAPPPPSADPRKEAVALKLQQARTALAQNRFAEAVGLLEEAERTLPGSDTSKLLEGARKEAAAAKVLDDTRELYAQGQFDAARQRLAEFVPAVVIGDVALSKVTRELEEAETQDRAQRTSVALDGEDLPAAEALYAELPRTEQAKLHARLEALRAKIAEDEASEARRQQSAAWARQKSQEQQRRQQIDQALESVRRRFDGGEWSRAALECDRVIEANRGDKELRERALALKRLIPQFGAALEEAQKKLRAGNVEGSAAPFKKARELHRQIGFPGGYAQEIDDQLARSSMAAAKSSLARNDLASAARHYRTALQLMPGDAGATSGLAQVVKRADELYFEAYIIRDRDPRSAGDKFRLVMDILPPEHPTFAKAQTQLSALTP